MSAVEDTLLNGYNNSKIRLVYYCLVLLASGIWLLYRRRWNSRLYQLGNKIPGPTTIPIFGNALSVLRKTPSELVLYGFGVVTQYGSVIRGWFGPNLYIFLSDPVDIEIILDSKTHIEKADEYKFFKPWLGEGLLISKGEKWQTHRKIIAPTFHHNVLKSFIGIFNENSKNVVEKMRSEIGTTFDVHEYMGGVTVDILLETAMGIAKETQDESGSDYAAAVIKMCDILQKRHMHFYIRPDIIFKMTSLHNIQNKLLNIIHGLTKRVIKNKKEIYLHNKSKGITPRTLAEITNTIDNDKILTNDEKTTADTVFKGYLDDLDHNDENDVGEKKRLAFLDLLLESSQNGTNKLTDHEIKEEVDTIMFEGHDTTAAGSSFVLCLMGIHQHIQDKVYNELHEIFGDSDRPVNFADTLKMKYLERVILESLRLFPPVPNIGRKLNQDVQISTNNYVLPAGSTVAIGIYHVHRNPKYWKNPSVFDPDNFLPENTQNRHYYSFIPFSAGPRSCVGRKYALLKLKILLATILRNYKMVSDITEDQYVLQADIILKRTDGFRVTIEPRKRIPSTA